MNAIKPAAIVFILAIGVASAATVAPAASRLQGANPAERVVLNQAIDASLPTITIVAKRLAVAERANNAG